MVLNSILRVFTCLVRLLTSLCKTQTQFVMLKPDTDFDRRRSRTSLASIFEDLVSLRKSLLNRDTDTLSQRSWVEKTFFKRECSKFIKSSRDATKCCCGRGEAWHGNLPRPPEDDTPKHDERWHPIKHSEPRPTDAYGTIEFQGAPHPSKAQYVRLSSFDTRPEQVLHLLQKHWGLDLPKLLITVHGGILNFDLQPKLKRVFRKGLLKAAKTTGAWIVTGGTNTGVTRHVGDAISDRTTKARNKVVAIGIAPWGIVENREDLIGRDIVVPYHCVSSPKTNSAVLNSNHSYFLLVDNGTMGKYGGEILFRKKLEKYIAQQKICITSGVKGRGVPVICVVLEGGANTIRSVLEYVTDTPPVPVVVCDGSGRAADLLAFTHKYTIDDGTMPESLRDQLIMTIQKTFQYTQEQAEKLFIELMLCVKKKELITVFRMSEGSQDIDLAILTALLKGTNASAPDQLSLALTWDRVDIARSHIFVYGQEWPEGSLEQAMMDALINDRVDFVKLLLENGVSMHTFLTIPRLEILYNTRQGPTNTLRYLIRDIRKHVPSNYSYTLPDVGLVVQHLMGGAFRSSYCRKRFRQKYLALKNHLSEQEGTSIGNVVTSIPHLVNTKQVEELFPYPFHDLMIWAVLMKRQKMSLFMWQHGEEAMAKALLACKLFKAMAHEADQDDLEIELSDEFRSYAKEFQTLALELLEHCYKIDDDYTQQLLTYELKNFSEQTCLSLAVAANHREFIAHTCCQVLLNDLWIGGLRMRKNTSMKVLLGILLPPYVAALEFKSKEELQLMPQTMEEHLEELADGASDIDNISVSSFDEDQVIENDFNDDLETSFHSALQVPAKENGTVPVDVSTYSNHPFKKKKSPLRLGKKIYEFYNAPITKFWSHTMTYLSFLVMFAFIILAKIKTTLRWQEYYVVTYILSLAVEKVRQIIASEPSKIAMKLRMFTAHIWNLWDTLAISLFTVGLGLRLNPSTLKAGHLVYTVDIVLWFVRIIENLSVNKYLGPYVKIIGKLLKDMAYFIIILFIVVTSFGVVRQSIHYQNEEMSWSRVLRNVWFYPYWMIYGELFAEDIDPCEDKSDKCAYGSWVAPAIMSAYLLVANILMINLLIARFNSTFYKNNAISLEIWKFQRYELIQEYEMRPILPPPLIIFSHLYLAFKYLRRRCKGKRDYYDNGLKLFLSKEDTEKLHDFEEECMEDYFRDKEIKFQSSSEERIRLINERVENMSMRVDDMNQKENTIKLSLQTVDYRLGRLEEIAHQTAEALNYIQSCLAHGENRSFPATRFLHPSISSHDSVIEQDLPAIIMEPLMTHDRGRASSTDLSHGRITPETLMHSQPSPVLIHSKKPLNHEQLEKFTNYSRGRQLSGGTYSSIPSVDTQSGSVDGQDSRKDGTPGESTLRSPDSTFDISNVKTFNKSNSAVPTEDPTSETTASSPATLAPSEATIARNPAAIIPSPLVIPPSPVTDDPVTPVTVVTIDSPTVSPPSPLLSPDSTSTPISNSEVPLLQRRHGPKLSTINVNKAKVSPESKLRIIGAQNINLQEAPSTTESHGEITLSPGSSAVFTTAKIPAVTNTSTIQGGPDKPANLNLNATKKTDWKSILTGKTDNAFTPISPEVTPLSPSKSITQTTGSFTTPDPEVIPQSAVRDLSSILTPLHAEYTSITDDIDTSCIKDRSPQRSPTSSNVFFSDSFSGSAPLETPAYKSEKELLRKAEEIEHRKMEQVIRNRLRQISMDESDSISDIAKLVVNELGMDVKNVPREDEVEEDEEEEEEQKIIFGGVEIKISSCSSQESDQPPPHC
ncbi:transient receptor potential cation channel subfamily M member 3-like isoform X4 [Haliotis rufescens]|uniref:transient receptor potential cation channel subfamily M member 3-like isoform X4 n=1 Tax=Haliotis rufescens TaxID=6454 RepID=UPI00201F10E1|nr:transient receptor potential cation channel subfamily M member 3-like isoform X4 [Haliotis rufescens]